MTLAQVEGGAQLGSAVQELGRLTAAVGIVHLASLLVKVVMADTIVHIAVTPHPCASNLGRGEVVRNALVP